MLLKWELFLSVFFRGFRGHKIRHYQIETVLVASGAGLNVYRQWLKMRSVSDEYIEAQQIHLATRLATHGLHGQAPGFLMLSPSMVVTN